MQMQLSINDAPLQQFFARAMALLDGPSKIIEGTANPRGAWNQAGNPSGNLPSRPTLVDPDEATLQAMKATFVESVMAGLEGTPDPMTAALMNTMDVYMTAMRERFAAASAGDGTWEVHAPSTVRRRGVGAPLMIETGELVASLEREAPDHILELE